MPYSRFPRLRRIVQVLRAASYGMFVGAGGVAIYIGQPVFSGWHLAMAALCVTGGVLSLTGQLADRWVGELLGLPLLGTAMLALSVLEGMAAGWQLLGVPSVLLLGAFGVLVAMRWVDLWVLSHASRNIARETRRIHV